MNNPQLKLTVIVLLAMIPLTGTCAYEELKDICLSELGERDRQLMITSYFFNVPYTAIDLSSHQNLASAAVEELNLENTEALKLLLMQDIRAGLITALDDRTRAWIVNILYLLKSENNSVTTAPAMSLLDVIRMLKEDLRFRELGLKVRIDGSLDPITQVRYKYKSQTGAYNIIRHTCTPLYSRPIVYFDYPYIVFEGLRKTSPPTQSTLSDDDLRKYFKK